MLKLNKDDSVIYVPAWDNGEDYDAAWFSKQNRVIRDEWSWRVKEQRAWLKLGSTGCIINLLLFLMVSLSERYSVYTVSLQMAVLSVSLVSIGFVYYHAYKCADLLDRFYESIGKR